jgi:hypothetical protein
LLEDRIATTAQQLFSGRFTQAHWIVALCGFSQDL